jgi:translation initiation factor eIF-2B subunit gamma
LYPLTENLPKALLPVGNKPLLAYTLDWLEKAQIKDIIIVTFPKWRVSISNYLSKVYECSEENDIQVLEVPPDSGTADALRMIKAKIKVLGGCIH